MGLVGRVLKTVDWGRYVATVNHAETIAPFIDPIMWLRSPHELRQKTTELARLFSKVSRLFAECEAMLPLPTAEDAAGEWARKVEGQ
jgi:hypothetical protein